MTAEMDLEEEFAKVPLTRATWGRILRYLAPHKKQLLFALTIEALWVCSMLTDPWLLKKAVDGPLMDRDIPGVLVYVFWLAFSVVARVTVTIIELRISTRIGIDVLHRMRRDVFDHLQRLSMRYYDRTKQGRILARADRDVDSLEHLLTWGPVVLVSMGSSLVLAFARLSFSHSYLAPWVLAALPVLWGLTRLFEKVGFPAYRRIRETHSAISSHVAEHITGVRVVKAFAAEDRASAQLSVLQRAYRGAILRGAWVTGAYIPCLSIAIQILVVAALVLGAGRVVDAGMSVGDLLESVLLLGFVLSPVEGLGGLYNECLIAGAAAERIFLLLDTSPEVADAPGVVDPGRLRGEVEFERVAFSYEPSGAGGRQLEDVSFHVRPGERVALVGHTGAGKTSILNLLARFYEPQEGAIRFDGKDVRTIPGAALHRQMGIVLQENFLFAGSVLENLRFVRADLMEAEARAGFAALGCLEVLDGLAAGLATDVGERGANLSEGERQIVCFVRAHLSEPSILILDEATSAVDTRTETLLLRALRALSHRQTTFVIAHRLSTVRDADLILVLENGRIAERGRHDDLLARGGVYAHLYSEYAK